MTNATPQAKKIDNDPVNHPTHYTSHPSGVECLEITRHMGFNLGNATKYIWRADLKHSDGGIEDLEKAEFYIKDEIAKRKRALAEFQSKMPTTTSGPDALNLDFFPPTTGGTIISKDVLSKVSGAHVG
jgi:Protein of unknwon function (DUF3310)